MLLTSFNELSLTSFGHRVRIADLTILNVEAYCTETLRPEVLQVALDANGYELFSFNADGTVQADSLKFSEKVPFNASERNWLVLLNRKECNLLQNPPKRSPRFSPLVKLPQ
jgi:hypothetical protein